MSRWQRDHEGSRGNAIGKFRWGMGFALVTAVGWGLNWPVPKYLPTELPLLSTLKRMPLVKAAVVGVVRTELAVQDHRQQAGAGSPAGDRMERRRRLGDGLASPTGEPLPHGLDHLPLARDHFQRLGDVLAQLGELAAAARAGTRRRDDDALARQMRRQRRAHRLST